MNASDQADDLDKAVERQYEIDKRLDEAASADTPARPDIRQQLANIVGFLLGVKGKDIIPDSVVGQSVEELLSLISQTVSSITQEIESNFANSAKTNISETARLHAIIESTAKRLLGDDDITKYAGVWKR